MAFIETPRFPENISYGSGGDVEFLTEVAAPLSGIEVREAKWSQARHNYTLLFDVITQAQYETVKEWFMAANGRAHSFRFKDHADYKSCPLDDTIAATDQTIGTGDGVTYQFQLKKLYTQGLSYTRTINKPVSGTVVISVGDSSIPSGWSVDTTTGIVSFPNIGGLSVTDMQSGSMPQITTSTHGLAVNQYVYLSAFTGDFSVLNGAWYRITNITSPTQFVVDADTTGFSSYLSNGGAVDARPPSGLVVKAGFEFDVPVRFDTDKLPSTWRNYQILAMDVPLIEVKL